MASKLQPMAAHYLRRPWDAPLAADFVGYLVSRNGSSLWPGTPFSGSYVFVAEINTVLDLQLCYGSCHLIKAYGVQESSCLHCRPLPLPLGLDPIGDPCSTRGHLIIRSRMHQRGAPNWRSAVPDSPRGVPAFWVLPIERGHAVLRS